MVLDVNSQEQNEGQPEMILRTQKCSRLKDSLQAQRRLRVRHMKEEGISDPEAPPLSGNVSSTPTLV